MFAETLGTEKIHVLLIEDSRNEAHLAQRQLYGADDEFDITRAARLDDGMALMMREQFGAVILDLGLPDSNGPESIQKLTRHFPEMPIVVLSGRSDEATVRQALEYGAQEFLAKNECSGTKIRHALLGAIIRKSLKN